MVHLFLLLFISSSLAIGNYSHLGTGTNPAVCQPDTCTLLSEVAAMREKLAAMTETQSKLEQSLNIMVQKMAMVEANSQFYRSQTEELWKVNRAQGELLVALKDNISSSKSKVAFTAALGISVGPLQQETTVKYPKILSNIGKGYNPATGIFTAMVQGAYYFRYTMFNNLSGPSNSVLSLMMNGQRLVTTWDSEGLNDNNDSASNAVVVELQPGDSVYVQLYARRVIFDDASLYNTFSGFMLFTM